MGGHAFKITRPITINEIFGKQGLEKLSIKNVDTKSSTPEGWGVIGRISELSDLSIDYVVDSTLGSVGKKPVCGDIDIAIDEKFGKDWFDKIIPNFDFVNDRNKSNGQLYTAVKIPGCNDYVQVDFMFGNREFLKFSYHSPLDSKYNGLVRTKFIMTLVSCLRYHNKYWADYIEDKIVAYAGPSFTLDRGIIWGYKHHYSKNKNGYNFDKIKKTADRFNDVEQFLSIAKQKHNDLTIGDLLNGYISTNNPDEICDIIFKKSSVKDFDSFETIYDKLMTSDYSTVFKQKVMEELNQRLEEDNIQV